MGLFSGISKAIGGLTKAIGGIGKALGGISQMLGGLMKSPLGGLLAKAFPPLGMAMGALNMIGMFSNLAGQVGGNQNY